jgi:magnesium chelatase family protein
LVGGGSQPAPGEISLAHHGVLFLDELPEFERAALDALREPLETGRITILRAAWQSEFPARFQLVTAMNPCPCGYAGDGTRRCRCGQVAIQHYRARLSGPLLDRLDLHVRVKSTEVATLLEPRLASDSSTLVRLRVSRTRALQLERQGVLNSALPVSELERHAAPDRETRELLQFAAERFNLSARACGRILRVARTIADLDTADAMTVHHVSEALLCRQLDGEGMDAYSNAAPKRHSPEARPGSGIH